MNNQYKNLIAFIVETGKNIKNVSSIILSDIEKDIKLKADFEINKKLISFLKNNYPYEILSEEDCNEISYTTFHGSFWIIDPLDGSLNFSRNIPMSCISISLWEEGESSFSCIYDFNRDELYYMENGICYINNQKTKTSIVTDTTNGVLCTGFPSWRNYQDESLGKFLQKIKNWKKIRAIGSAALSLAWVARGWADAYIEEDIRIWDVAAGLSLVKAAGGEIFVKENERPNFVTAIATNGKIPVSELQ